MGGNIEMVRQRFLLCVYFFLVVGTSSIMGQNYGLEFTAREKNADYRTELDLSSLKSFRFKHDFEISFDLFLRSQVVPTSYFGYILRVIGNDQYNIDLMHNKIFVDSVDLNMVFGENTPSISYDFVDKTHFDHWINIRLRFSISKNELDFILPDTSFTKSGIPIDYDHTIKFVFGACNQGHFKTRDIPPFNLRDIKITENNKLKYHWPLNEYEGTEARDLIHNRIALVRNPNWIKKMHLNWTKSFEYSMKGNVLVAANSDDEKVYLIGDEKMLIYSLLDDSSETITFKSQLTQSSREQAVYSSSTNSIYCYNVDEHEISIFNLMSQEWHFNNSEDEKLKGFRHHNKFLSKSDSLLYIFGGYGYHRYSNFVQQVNLHTNEWRIFDMEWEEIFKPRYLAALGESEDTVYLLGGYGSPSGDQMINPQVFPELLAYSITDNRFMHKFDLKLPKDDYVFGNSMIIDATSRNYYALAFSQFKVDNSLRLVRGNLDRPTIELMADEIGYTHYDTKSFVDLFYFPTSDYMVTYTGIVDEDGNTEVELNRLKFPPNSMPIQLETSLILNQRNTIIVLALFSIIAVVSLIYFKKKNKKENFIKKNDSSSEDEIEEWKLILDKLGLSKVKNMGVHCFGGFRVFDAERKDITGEFTPLLKELYLLILLHTLKDDKGISSDWLLEILWFDKGLESARNNRAVNVAKLRAILERVGNCEITHNTGYWKIISHEPQIYNDYQECIKITQSIQNPTKHDIIKLIQIAGKGPFLGNVSYEWLDAFKSNTSDSIINTLIRFSDSLDIKHDAHLIIQITDCIFNFDSINEDAMILRCKAQNALGSHSSSKTNYNRFRKEYKNLYGEDYSISFKNVITKSRSEIINN